MATSGSVDFSVSRDNLLEDAMRMSGIIGIEDSASATQLTWAARQLNMMIKSWHGYGIGLWARKTGWLLPHTDTNEINVGPTGNHATASYVTTLTSATAVSGASTIEVDSITGMATTYNIGITTADGVQWTTINGAPSGTTVTLTDALTADVANDARVYVYQTKLMRPVRIIEAYVRDETGATEYEIDVAAKAVYEGMGAKESEGVPNLIAYDPLLTDGKVYVYPRFKDGSKTIKIVFQRPFEDFDAANDTPDFPQEWYLAIMYNLAVIMAPVGGLPVADRNALRGEAKATLGEALMNEPEQGSFQIMPAERRR